jgi:hypothetical protein
MFFVCVCVCVLHMRVSCVRSCRHACLISNAGVPSLVVEQSKALTNHPQAHYINNRTMEVRGTLLCVTQAALSKLASDCWRGFKGKSKHVCNHVHIHPHTLASVQTNTYTQVFRAIGGGCETEDGGTGKVSLAAEVTSATPPLNEWRKFVYCHSMVGEVLGEVDHFKGGWAMIK